MMKRMEKQNAKDTDDWEIRLSLDICCVSDYEERGAEKQVQDSSLRIYLKSTVIGCKIVI